MADHHELDTAIGKMKRAAIDSYMADAGYYPASPDDDWYHKWGWSWLSGFDRVTRPTSSGFGGGYSFQWGNPFLREFETIRGTIDGMMRTWRYLPDGSASEGIRAEVGSALAKLGAQDSEKSESSSSEIGLCNGYIDNALTGPISGSFTTPFLFKYHKEFSLVVEGTVAVSSLLEATYAAQRDMWDAARRDLVDLCEAAAGAWSLHADSSAAESREFTLTVLSAVMTAVAAALTAGSGALVIGGITLTAGALAIGSEELPKEVPGNSYDDILGSLARALQEFNKLLTKQERKLLEHINNADADLSDNRKRYNLRETPLDTYVHDVDTIAMQQDKADTVSRAMKDIQTVIEDARSRLGTGADDNPTPRNVGVGIGVNGIHNSVSKVHRVMAVNFRRTVEEYDRGRELFELTVEDYFNTDVDNRAEIEKMQAAGAVNYSTSGV